MSAENETIDTPAESSGGKGFQPNTVSGTLIVAVGLCLICSLLVSGGAVLLRPSIQANKRLKMQRNVLIAAGKFDEATNSDADIPGLFESVQAVLVNLPGRTGMGELEVDDANAGQLNSDLDVDTYDPRKAAKNPEQSVAIPADLDEAGIRRREQVATAYIVKGENGAVSQIVLPVYGKGLWSTLYGFLALKADNPNDMPVTGITFYEHGETPGLGGEVDNPKWKAQWPGKEILADGGKPILDVTKPGQASETNEVDGMSGATITSNGVEGLVNYWLGPDGFGPFLERYRDGQVNFTAESQGRVESAE